MRKHVSVKTVFSNWMTSDGSRYSRLILFGVFEFEFVAFEVERVFGSEDELGFMYILESVGNEGSLYPFKQAVLWHVHTNKINIHPIVSFPSFFRGNIVLFFLHQYTIVTRNVHGPAMTFQSFEANISTDKITNNMQWFPPDFITGNKKSKTKTRLASVR